MDFFDQTTIKSNLNNVFSEDESMSIALTARLIKSAKAMANFKAKGMSSDAKTLNDFIVREIRSNTENESEFKRIYKCWYDAVNQTDAT